VTTISVPKRLRWTVDTLAVDPDDHLLEIGCGRGVAVSLICERLAGGKIIALDRSMTMVRLAEQRNLEHVSSGKAVFRAVELADADLSGERFDKVFAVNVSLFWLRSPSQELDLIRRVLKPAGALYLFYEPPEATRATEIADRLTAALAVNGYTARTLTATTTRSALLCAVARPRRRPRARATTHREG
jgi:ubiquinone/menaquinone biosynthesis C-methylase UbiE